MKKLSLGALALFVMTAAAATLRSGNIQSAASPELMTNAAYRDGLYVGKLAAKQGIEPHAAIGRWSRTEDRENFAAGYQQSYNAVVASRTAGID